MQKYEILSKPTIMAGKSTALSYEDLVRDIRAKKFAPVYCLMGEEGYYIDRLMTLIQQTAVDDSERDFNETILYGNETSAEQILDAVSRYPMMAERQVVVVREAQAIKEQLEHLVSYVQNPNPATVLVICHKHGVLDKRKKLISEIQKNGVVFESNALWDNQLPSFVIAYLKEKKVLIDRSACELLCASVGADLSRLSSELDKLCIALGEGVNEIGMELVARQVGESKDYNSFELIDALVARDNAKAMRIVNYFGNNPRGFALPALTSALFGFFSNLMLAYYAPVKSESGVAQFVGCSPWIAKKSLIPALNAYTGRKTLQIIRMIRRSDACFKGVDCSASTDYDILRDLVYFILH